MRILSLSILAGAAILSLSSCYTVPIAPAVYEESRSDAYYWTLIMGKDGRYDLLRLDPNSPKKNKDVTGDASSGISFEGEKGKWTKEDNKVLLKSETGSVRTFSVRRDLGGHYLVEDGKAFPVLRWTAEEQNYQ